MSRVEYVECRDRRILRLDYSGLSGAEVVAAMEQAMPVIAAEPPRSIRALTIWNTRLTNEIADAIKRYVAHNTPYIYASAIVTATPFQKVVFEALRALGRERLQTFDDERQAKEWLAVQ